MSKYRNITKLAKPGTSTTLSYVVNIYRNGDFRFAYCYNGWSCHDMHDEVRLLRRRFPDYKGWKVEQS